MTAPSSKSYWCYIYGLVIGDENEDTRGCNLHMCLWTFQYTVSEDAAITEPNG